MRRPKLTIAQIIAWADEHYARTGNWPHTNSGRIPGSLGETWVAVAMAFRNRGRGLSVPGMTLTRLLARERGVRHHLELPRLTERQIVAWAEAYRRRTGLWPTDRSGSILEAPGESWRGIDKSLRYGRRGLPGNSSLSRLLAKQHRPRLHRHPPFTIPQILGWADAHHARTANWPTRWSGSIVDAKGTSWMMVHRALLHGEHGLPGGTSLTKLLFEQRGVRRLRRSPLKVKKIIQWAVAHRKRTGKLPSVSSGPIVEAPDVTWLAVDMALRQGNRGLPGGSSLHRILHTQNGGLEFA